jgi:predicted ATPase/DNA-binding SARP family transcriptional activator
MRQIAIRLLGPFEASIDGRPIAGFEYAKVRALLAYLAFEGSRPLPRSFLAALLWPEQPERNARNSLSRALTSLRDAFDDRNTEQPLVLADTQQVWLNPRVPVELDVRHLLNSVEAAAQHQHRSWRTCALCEERLRQALDLYRGDFLADIAIADSAQFEEWASQQREHLRQRALSALERLVERAEWQSAYSTALGYAQRLVALDPLLEQNQRAVMRLLALNGEWAAAQVHYRRLRIMLEQELGVEPDAATTALFEQIRAGEIADLRASPPPLVAPLPATPLVGRDEELQGLCAELRAGGRAITLAGVGGVGKTRLAIAAAQALRFDFEDGVRFVELAALGDAALVADAVARVLEVKERPRQPIVETLREYLWDRHLLLILDNFEHVVSAAPFIEELLASCSTLSVLVTSRAPLTLRANRLVLLEPLTEAAAIQLFLERAHAVGAALSTDEASVALCGAICRRLDRLPLAIELIAVRARLLTPHELLRQLEQPLHVLTRGPRDLSARHQSLRHAIQWSYDLLDSEERRAFRMLGVFAGGCTVEAAQAVLGPSLVALPLLEALCQASLLQRQTVAEQTRYVLLETIREFALEQLVRCDEVMPAQQLHSNHYALFAMAAHRELLGPETSRWIAWVAAEQDNLRAAFRWAIEHEQYETALQLTTGVRHFHWMCGALREGLEQLEEALAHRDAAPLQLQCDALQAAGVLATGLNEYIRARGWLEAAVAVGWQLGEQRALLPVLTQLGKALLEQGEMKDARVYLEVALSLARRAEDPLGAKSSLGFLAHLHQRLGQFDEARAFAEECLRLNQATGDREGTAEALRRLAAILLAQGNIAAAQPLADEALAIHRLLKHQLGIGLGLILQGDIARAEGAYPEALVCYHQCLELWKERENTITVGYVLDYIGRTLFHMDDPARVATLFSAAAAMREYAGVKLTAYEKASCDQAYQNCRVALGDEAFDAAWALGRTLRAEEAVALALQPHALVDW